MAKVVLRCFAGAREASGCSSDSFVAASVHEVLELAAQRYGIEWQHVLATSRVWLNGDEPQSGPQTVLRDGDEVAVLPPVSGG